MMSFDANHCFSTPKIQATTPLSACHQKHAPLQFLRVATPLLNTSSKKGDTFCKKALFCKPATQRLESKRVGCTSRQTEDIIQHVGETSHAIVVGAGVVGMLTAKVLSQYYGHVTLYDKQQLHTPKELPEAFTDKQLVQAVRERTGAAQNGLPNILNMVAAMIVEQHFPGITQQFLQAGAFEMIPKEHVQIYIDSTHINYAPSTPAEARGTLQSKMLTETMLRYRLMRDCPNVEFVGGKAVARFLFSEDRENVTGVVFTDGSTARADFVAHVGGRTCNPSSLLAAGGYPAVPEEVVDANQKFLGIIMRNDESATVEDVAPGILTAGFFHNSPTSRDFSTALVCQQEDNRMVSILFHKNNDNVPKTVEEYISKLKSANLPGMADYLDRCTPVSSKVHVFASPSRWRRFDLMPSMPGGAVFLGDVSCANSPAMGQGMQCGLQCVQALDQMLADTRGQAKDGTWVHKYQKTAAGIQFPTWVSSLWVDMQYTDTVKKISLATRVVAWYFRLLTMFVKDSGDAQIAGGYQASWAGIIPFGTFVYNPVIILLTLISTLKSCITSLGKPSVQTIASEQPTAKRAQSDVTMQA